MNKLIFLALILSVLLGGCAVLAPTPPHRPYFALEASDLKWFQALTRKQEGVVAKCNETSSCDHAYFMRGLLGLYESREIAEKYFGKVITTAPKSQLAASSKAWILLLQQYPPKISVSWFEAVVGGPVIADTNALLEQAAERLVRDLLDQEGVVQQLRAIKKEEDSQAVEQLQRELADRDRKLDALLKKAEPSSVQSLQKQVAERDKKIEELSAQLEALKRIDQEMREKVRPLRPPSTAVPAPAPDAIP